ncbi:DUF5713 family protein [Hymenobacter metallicola]|uniref:Uncharacterized protein n=1 Tax=Hymenobacter metallicola TaxID=2563114 RepID=A0A4Z0QGV7_9BACT|nr:DUF5713 family protein [Hymenobacter metallicola]TGE28945.1 hypothetical protein E5K02_05645 [Hymenobacter metallicola]
MTNPQDNLKNQTVREYLFLQEMYEDPYFPNQLVDKGRIILVKLCADIEQQQPQDLEALYALTQAATEQFNDLQEEFFEAGSEIETAARDCIARDFGFIAKAYGFEADLEELIATRDW